MQQIFQAIRQALRGQPRIPELTDDFGSAMYPLRAWVRSLRGTQNHHPAIFAPLPERPEDRSQWGAWYRLVELKRSYRDHAHLLIWSLCENLFDHQGQLTAKLTDQELQILTTPDHTGFLLESIRPGLLPNQRVAEITDLGDCRYQLKLSMSEYAKIKGINFQISGDLTVRMALDWPANTLLGAAQLTGRTRASTDLYRCRWMESDQYRQQVAQHTHQLEQEILQKERICRAIQSLSVMDRSVLIDDILGNRWRSYF